MRSRWIVVPAVVAGLFGTSLAAGHPATAATAVKPGAVSVSPATAGATSVTYTDSFQLASNLATDGSITLVAPNGTAFPAASCNNPVGTCNPDDYSVSSGGTDRHINSISVSATTGPGDHAVSSTANKVVIQIGIVPGTTPLTAGSTVTVQVAGAANPTAASSSYVLEEWTSADTVAVDSRPYAIVAGPPASASATSGAGQSAAVGNSFAAPLTVTVRDRFGNPVAAGTHVQFDLPGAGANSTVPGATFLGDGGQSTVVTNAAGVAVSPYFSANQVVGSWYAAAKVTNLQAVPFAEQNTPPQPATTPVPAGAQLAYVLGDGQRAHVGGQFADPLEVRLVDAQGAPVAGAAVTFTVPGGGAANFPAGRTVTAETDGSGLAVSPPLAAGLHPGSYQASAAAGAALVGFHLANTDGYWLADTDGSVQPYGDAPFLGSTAGARLSSPIIGMAATPDRQGYWLVASDGGIFAFGDARFLGSTGGVTLNRPVVGMASTPDGRGYWLVASDGGIFAFGDARFLGSTGGVTLNRPVVGMASTPDGRGYWLVASDGGIFAFGRAGFYGSAGGVDLVEPIVGMAAAPSGRGYWFVASDGGIFGYGPDAVFEGSGSGFGHPVAAMAEG